MIIDNTKKAQIIKWLKKNWLLGFHFLPGKGTLVAGTGLLGI
jgi:hypothetical protein